VQPLLVPFLLLSKAELFLFFESHRRCPLLGSGILCVDQFFSRLNDSFVA